MPGSGAVWSRGIVVVVRASGIVAGVASSGAVEGDDAFLRGVIDEGCFLTDNTDSTAED